VGVDLFDDMIGSELELDGSDNESYYVEGVSSWRLSRFPAGPE
jgi:hypothetical protein